MRPEPLDFVPYGAAGSLPSAHRWLEFLEGPSAGPPTGIMLGHASESALLFVSTYPRSRFDAAMAPDDKKRQLQEVAFSVTHRLINCVLVELALHGDERSRLIRSLARFADEQAVNYRGWSSDRWQLKMTDEQSETADAFVISLAGWQARFTAAHPYLYIAAHAYGADLAELALSPVTETSAYNFEAAAPSSARILSFHLGARCSA